MTDTKKLEDLIKDSGKTKSHIAKKAGMSIQTLRLKMTNKFPFTTDEVQAIAEEVHIHEASELMEVFFLSFM